ncbi:MAG: sel1 repeat family protein [Deltaproteobacteria bacterium]|nr:sel1 repeat family protein [Deltaproteobacteria bacterium]
MRQKLHDSYPSVKLLAEAGDHAAQFILGTIYFLGEGAPQDQAEGLKWFRLAAEGGSLEAMATLKNLYEKGQGVAKDPGEAAKWARLMVERGEPSAQEAVNAELFDSNSLAQKMVTLANILDELSPDEVKEALKILSSSIAKKEDAAVERRQAATEELEARFKRALALFTGQGAVKDIPEGLRLLRSGAESGHPDSQNALACVLFSGQGVPKDLNEAIKWFHLAAENGSPEAQHYLGVLYINGEGLTQDFKEAAKWFNKAAINGYYDPRNAAKTFHNNQNELKELAADFQKVALKAEEGDMAARFEVGIRLLMGFGVAKDLKEAAKWLALAATQGHPDARGYLDLIRSQS